MDWMSNTDWRKEVDDERLCIRLQLLPDGKWFWNVGYPHGLTYDSGTMNTPEDALAVAKVALHWLSQQR